MAEQTEVIIINWRDAQVILAFKRKVTHWDTLRHRGALFYYWYDTCSIVIGWRKRRPKRYFKNRHRFASEVHSFSPSPHRTLVLSLSLSLSRHWIRCPRFPPTDPLFTPATPSPPFSPFDRFSKMVSFLPLWFWSDSRVHRFLFLRLRCVVYSARF